MPDNALRIVHRFCFDCQGRHHPSVLACADRDCLLYPLRYGDTGEAAAGPGDDAPVRVIRRFCLACAGSRREVRGCDAKASCPLWSYRFGVTPATFKRVAARRRLWRMQLSLPGLGSAAR